MEGQIEDFGLDCYWTDFFAELATTIHTRDAVLCEYSHDRSCPKNLYFSSCHFKIVSEIYSCNFGAEEFLEIITTRFLI